MKIAFVSAAQSIHIVRWANAMNERGHDVTVITCKNHMPSQTERYEKGVRIIPLKFSAPLGYYLNVKRLKKLVKREKFDIVNVHYASGYATLARRAKLKDALLNIWGSDVYEFPYASAFNMRTSKKNLAYFKGVASTSRCMAAQAAKIADREYFITPFGVDISRFKPIEGYRNDSRIVIGTVKTLSPKYGIDVTINAFISAYNRLKEENSGLASRLYYQIYGRGEQREELQKLIDGSGMSDRITLCGFVENSGLPQVYNKFDIAVYGSVAESFGVAAVEAMACGLPVCATDADGFKEVISDGKTGFISPKGDAGALAGNIYTLIKDKDLRAAMGKAGVERVASLYDWDKNVDIMENIYNSLVGENDRIRS